MLVTICNCCNFFCQDCCFCDKKLSPAGKFASYLTFDWAQTLWAFQGAESKNIKFLIEASYSNLFHKTFKESFRKFSRFEMEHYVPVCWGQYDFSWSATGMDFSLRGILIVCVRCHWAMLLIGAQDICFKKTPPSNDQSTFSVDTRFSIQKMFDDNVG